MIVQPADIGRLVGVSDPAVSPDGSRVAVTVSRIDVEANRGRSAVWLVPTDGPPRQFSAGKESDRGARWSPTGDRLAFVRTAKDDGKPVTSILVAPANGPGEPVAIAVIKGGIDGPLVWSPDGQRLAWCARVDPLPPDTDDRDREPRQIRTLFTRLDDVGFTVDARPQVWVGRVDGTEAPRPVTDGDFDHGPPAWSPDGTTLVVAAGRHDDWDLDWTFDLWLFDADAPAGTAPRRLTEGGLQWSQASWSPDGTRIVAVATDPTHGYASTHAYVLDVATGAAVDLAPDLDRTFNPYPGGRPAVWLDDDHVLLSYEDRGTVPVARIAVDGSEPLAIVVGADTWVTGYDCAAGTLAYVSGSTTTLGELTVEALDPDADIAPVRTTFGAAFHRACPPQPVERFTVPSPADDVELDVWFLPPAGRADQERWPLLVVIHGGPMTQFGEKFFDEFHLYASAGFAVVGCNPHGASGLTNAFGRSIRSPLAAIDPGTGWGGIDADDILAVLWATLTRHPAIDPARVGVLGGSYGGYMTSWLLAKSDEFAAGCSERAVNNLLSEEWSSDAAGTFEAELGVSPLEHPEEYLRMSPAMFADQITAPVLILHSENDLRCNIEQADALFVPLRRRRHDVEYWRFPGEGHEMSRSGSPKHRIKRAELVIDFFKRKLG